ncbi:MAG: CDP-alcohol phosphatidyltransferase family protein [Solirubrobacterales bacterium]
MPTSRRRLFGLDRSGPLPRETRRGAPLHPWTIPNLVGYVRLGALPVFCLLAFESEDGRATAATLLYLGITLGDYVDGFLARATGQYSRMGALLDPIVDRLAVLSGAAVTWHFELLPRWAIVVLALRELATVYLSSKALRHGIDIEVNWIGRIGVFLVFGGIFWTMVFDWWILEVGFVVGVLFTVLATVIYVRAARGAHPDDVTWRRHRPA